MTTQEKTTYHVWADHSLLYHKPGMGPLYGTLAALGSKGRDPFQGIVAPAEADLRPATVEDFERFRVSSKGYDLG